MKPQSFSNKNIESLVRLLWGLVSSHGFWAPSFGHKMILQTCHNTCMCVCRCMCVCIYIYIFFFDHGMDSSPSTPPHTHTRLEKDQWIDPTGIESLQCITKQACDCKVVHQDVLIGIPLGKNDNDEDPQEIRWSPIQIVYPGVVPRYLECQIQERSMSPKPASYDEAHTIGHQIAVFMPV